MSVDIADTTLRRYLLATIDPENRDYIERRLASDDRILYELLTLAEDELIDAYVTNALVGPDLVHFTSRFLCTNERRERVALARELTAYAQREDSAHKPVRDLLWRQISLPAWGVAVAGLLMLLRPGITWQFAGAGAGRAQDEVSVRLTAGLLRGGGELARVRVPAASKLIRLQLEAEGSPSQAFRATLYQASGNEIASQTDLRLLSAAGRSELTLLLPADLLAPGDYYIRLHEILAGQDPLVAGRFDFRVLKE